MDKDEYKVLVSDYNSTKHKFYGYYDENDEYKIGFLDVILDPIIESGSLIETMGEAFDINNASGEQLDIIGEMVGISRLLPVVPTIGNREMDDDEYLMCIRMSIARNNWDGTNESAVRLYEDVLGSAFSIYYIDNQDMTVDINITGVSTIREAEVLFLTDVLLVPAGVAKNAVVIDSRADTSIKMSMGFSGEIVYENINIVQ